MKTNDGRLVVIAGASRCGKTTHVSERVADACRVWAWDPEDQWSQLPGYVRVTNRGELLKLMHTSGPQKVAFCCGGSLSKAFDFWAGCVQYAGRYVAPVVAIAEELADVTSASKAPGNWGVLLRRGLKRGTSIYAISQRWAEADKTALGNASEFVIFRQNTGDDAKYMSRKTRVPLAEIDALHPLEYVKYDTHSFEIQRGTVNFAKKIPDRKAVIRRKTP